jgi:hypothetical protein
MMPSTNSSKRFMVVLVPPVLRLSEFREIGKRVF